MVRRLISTLLGVLLLGTALGGAQAFAKGKGSPGRHQPGPPPPGGGGAVSAPEFDPAAAGAVAAVVAAGAVVLARRRRDRSS